MTDRRSELDSRIEEFHGVTLGRVLGEIEYLRDVGDTVIAGGSLAYGLGNVLSDLDIVVTGPTTIESSRVPLEHFLSSLRVDVWKLSQELIERSFRRAERALADPGELLGAFGDIDNEDEFKLLHRIAFGLVLDGPPLEFEALDCGAVAAELVIREYAERMRASALVAQLALRTGRSVAAVFNARLAVESALNALVLQRGHPFCSDKWLGERLVAEFPELAAAYRPFRCLPGDPGRDGAGYVAAALAVCTEMWGVDLALEALADGARWHDTEEVRLAEIGSDHLLLASRPGVVWELEQNDVEVWRRLTAAQARDGDDGWRLNAGDPEALALCVRLYEHGLLGLRWIEGVPTEVLGRRRKAAA